MHLDWPKSAISRREFIRLSLTLTGASTIAACTSPGDSSPTPTRDARVAPAASTSAPAVPRRGGALAVALVGGPPSLDPHWTASHVTADVCGHVVEHLFTVDNSLRVVPQLAATLETSPDGLTHTIGLRRGVTFHNGKELTSEDVDSSLLRWAKLSPTGQALFARVDFVRLNDKHTLTVRMKRATAAFAAALATRPQGAAIMPREVVEPTSVRSQVRQLIGTGPYRLAEHGQDGQVTLARWDGFRRSAGESGAGAAQREAYLDEIRFRPVPDQTARLAGIQSGEYQFAYGADVQQFASLSSDARVAPFLGALSRTPTHHFNLESDVAGTRKLRQAILAALDPDAALRAAWGSRELFQVNGSLMLMDSPWYTATGAKGFNQRNVEAARTLIKEANYRNQPIRYLTSIEYPAMHTEATNIAQQLIAVGLNVQVENLDWTTLVARRAMAEQWEMFSTWHDCAYDPALLNWNDPKYPGWWSNDTIADLREKLHTTLGQRERMAVLEKTQEVFYEQVPLLKLGEVREFCLASPRLKGIGSLPHTNFWNAYLTA